jgi:hypothetical protein
MNTETPGSTSSHEEAIQRVLAVKARHESELMRKSNVIGVGVGFREKAGQLTEEITLVVNVSHKLPRSQLAPQDFVPAEIEGVPVDVREIGEIRSQS